MEKGNYMLDISELDKVSFIYFYDQTPFTNRGVTHAYIPVNMETVSVDKSDKPAKFLIAEYESESDNMSRFFRACCAQEKLFNFLDLVSGIVRPLEVMKKIMFNHLESKKIKVITFDQLQKLKKRAWVSKMRMQLYQEYRAGLNSLNKGEWF